MDLPHRVSIESFDVVIVEAGAGSAAREPGTMEAVPSATANTPKHIPKRLRRPFP
jgi:hypothetical protein